MIYNETMNSGIIILGCPAVLSVGHLYLTAFGPGDVTYSVWKAKHGILEKVVIKQIVSTNRALTGGLFVVLYRDTLNALWNESDLVSFDQAQTLAEAYYEMLIEERRNLLGNC